MDTSATIIFILQVVCCSLLLVMYIPQILKISHSHSVVGISLPYNYVKILLTIVSALVLELTDNSFIVIMAQYVSLALSGVLLAQIVYYLWKDNKRTQIYVMVAIMTVALSGVAVLTTVIQDVMTVICILQVASFVVMFAQYIPQVLQLFKCKTVGDVSITHWLCKLIYTVFSLGILVISHNCLIVTLTQIFNFIFTLIIFAQCIHYKGESVNGKETKRVQGSKKKLS